MTYTVTDVLQYVEENDVKFVKLQFTDAFGFQKNISINASELSRAFTEGISFDASGMSGLLNSEENLLLIPDAATLTILPWRPHQGGVARLICDVKRADEGVFEGNSREILKNAVREARDRGITFEFGTSCEFYLFKLDDNGNPTKIPHDNGGYMDVAPFDKGENIRRDICLTLEQMDFSPESSRHEGGPGHNEIDFQCAKPLAAADNFMTFKSVVKNISEQNGLYASFMPKPFADKQGNGLHIEVKIFKDRKNIFSGFNPERNKLQASVISGILKNIRDMTLFLNPTVNSYKRLGQFMAPEYITWSTKNMAQLLRVPVAADGTASLILRSGDCACNPYIAFALVIYACLDGIESGLPYTKPVNINFEANPDHKMTDMPKLPSALGEAALYAEKSEFINSRLDKKIVSTYVNAANEQAEKYKSAENSSDFELENYFYRL